MSAVSRDILRAVLEARDHRHNETHAALVAMFQALAAELIEQGALAPGPLADRLEHGVPKVEADPHGAAARDMLDHTIGWLRGMDPSLPQIHPQRWFAPDAADENN